MSFLPSSPSSLSLSQALKKMGMVGKKVEMVEKKVEVVGLEKEVEMVGVVGHYNSPPLIRNSSPNSCHKLTCPMSS